MSKLLKLVQNCNVNELVIYHGLPFPTPSVPLFLSLSATFSVTWTRYPSARSYFLFFLFLSASLSFYLALISFHILLSFCPPSQPLFPTLLSHLFLPQYFSISLHCTSCISTIMVLLKTFNFFNTSSILHRNFKLSVFIIIK